MEDGRYRGRPGRTSFDGLWELEGERILVEVKTTDAYSIDLDTIANYRRQLIKEGSSSRDDVSLLLVVGRKDTGGLEAQVRGSRHAWDMRIISVSALLRLMELKETLDDPATARRISDILIPQEFTKLDGIIDLVFMTAEEVASPDDPAPDEGTDDSEQGATRKPKFTPVRFHDACVERLEKHLGLALIKQSRSIFRAPEQNVRVWVAVSTDISHMGARDHHGHVIELCRDTY